MNHSTNPSELSDGAQARIDAVDEYLALAIEAGRPIEALYACQALGTVIQRRTREAAQAAVSSTWSWANVGDALGVSKQAAHEKLSRHIRSAQEKLEQGEQTGHQKIREYYGQARENLNARPGKREQARHDKLTKQIQAAREQVTRQEQKAEAKLDGKLGK